MKSAKKVEAVEPFAFTPEQFRTWYPSSRASVSMWMRSGELPSFREGSKRLIPVEGAREFARRRAARSAAVSPEVSAARSIAGKTGRAAQLAARLAAGVDKAPPA
jgi:hypothetical protein